MSLDTASKDNLFNDYTAIVVARISGKLVHVVAVYRQRLQFPDLKAKTIELARLHGAKVLLIEDAASGQQLIQVLRAEDHVGVPMPIARRPEGPKAARVMGASAMIEAGRLYIPERAHWVAEYVAELTGFPGAAHDDQVDATTQLLLWVQEKDIYQQPVNAGPMDLDHPDFAQNGLDEWDYDQDPWAGR